MGMYPIACRVKSVERPHTLFDCYFDVISFFDCRITVSVALSVISFMYDTATTVLWDFLFFH